MTGPPTTVLVCPHCGLPLLVCPVALVADLSDRAREVPSSLTGTCTSTSTSTSNTAALRAAVRSSSSTKKDTDTGTSTARARDDQRTLPLPPTLANPAPSTWKRVLAIAHRAIDDYPDDGASQTERCKELCAQQGIDYGAAGPDGRPLYARALDYALEQRRRRVAGGAR